MGSVNLIDQTRTMKSVCLAIIALCILYATADKCSGTDTSTCIHTICDSTTEIKCINGACTCEDKLDLSCTSRQDCLDLTPWNCNLERRHCVDQKCTCIRI